MAVELVHLASLYHDDVMDEATVRRNVESVNARFGNLVAIVAGDFLLARSAEIAASLGTEIAGLLANTLGLLCQGQVTEVRVGLQHRAHRGRLPRGHRGQDRRAHVDLVPHRRPHRRPAPPRGRRAHRRSAAASACSSSCATTSSTSIATDEELGKPAGQDLAEGIYTLPVLLALRDPGDRARAARRCSGQPLDQPERDKARADRGRSPAPSPTP